MGIDFRLQYIIILMNIPLNSKYFFKIIQKYNNITNNDLIL